MLVLNKIDICAICHYRKHMAVEKIFIGPKLREMRQSRKLTQAEMAKALGVSASYINLIERNQRSASLRFLIALSDTYGINWRQLTQIDSSLAISDLREITADPAFGNVRPDIEELRTAIDNSPNLVKGIFNLFRQYRDYGERLAADNEALASVRDSNNQRINPSAITSEQLIYDFFREHNNYFEKIEKCAEKTHKNANIDRDEPFGSLKSYLKETLNITVRTVPTEILGPSLRHFDRKKGLIQLSTALDYTNKVFHLAHSIAMIEHFDAFTEIIHASNITDEHSVAKCRVELANYFSAALMMPYKEFYQTALDKKYDIDNLASYFAVSYEQICQRLTTLQKPGQRAIPFFFLRLDKGGNISKRFNATPIQLAQYGGACPRLDIHYCFRVPSRILTQIVEMPDNSKYLTINRTVDRPAVNYSGEDKRLAVSLGCPIEHAPFTVYGQGVDLKSQQFVTEVGTNCRLCPPKTLRSTRP